MEMPALPAPCENRGGGALDFLRAGCLKCESDVRARKRVERFGETNPRASRTIAPLALFTLPWRGRVAKRKRAGWGDLLCSKRNSPHPAAFAHFIRSASTLPLQGRVKQCA